MSRAAVPVVLVAVLLAAGCGTAHYPAAGNGRGGGRGSVPATASIGERARAEAGLLARALLARAPVPRGARVLAGRAPAVVSQPPDGLGGTPSFAVHAIWTLSQPSATVYGFVAAHVPAGMSSGGSGQSGDSAGITEQFVSYSPRKLPAWVDQATLSMTVAPSRAGTLLRADAQVVWYPPRSAAEHIPAGMHAVSVSVSYFGSGPSSHTASKTFTSAALIARLAAMLNGAHASVGGAMSCPLQRDTYKLAFATSPAAAPYLVATAGPCAQLAVTVLGHPQPSLQEPAALAPALTRLLGRPADLPPSARIPPGQ